MELQTIETNLRFSVVFYTPKGPNTSLEGALGWFLGAPSQEVLGPLGYKISVGSSAGSLLTSNFEDVGSLAVAIHLVGLQRHWALERNVNGAPKTF